MKNVKNMEINKNIDDWISRKAKSLQRRDRKKSGKIASVDEYRKAIKKAIEESCGRDYYTGEKLDWHLITDEKVGRSKRFHNLPTIDHYNPQKKDLDFKICSWVVNDMKSDLQPEEFIKKIEKIIKYWKIKSS